MEPYCGTYLPTLKSIFWKVSMGKDVGGEIIFQVQATLDSCHRVSSANVNHRLCQCQQHYCQKPKVIISKVA